MNAVPRREAENLASKVFLVFLGTMILFCFAQGIQLRTDHFYSSVCACVCVYVCLYVGLSVCTVRKYVIMHACAYNILYMHNVVQF